MTNWVNLQSLIKFEWFIDSPNIFPNNYLNERVKKIDLDWIDGLQIVGHFKRDWNYN